MTMTLQLRQEIERQIIQRIVTDALEAGFQLTVDDGGDQPSVKRSTDQAAIMGAVMLTDEDRLYYSKPGEPLQGWVRLIYGNDGWDVVNDYTTNLEPLLAGASAEADRLEAKHG
jgi:ribosomal protein L35AE/L33A